MSYYHTGSNPVRTTKNKNMTYKEEFYNKVGKFPVNELKSFLEKENYTFDDFRKEYQSWKAEEERYKKRLDKLDKPKQIIIIEPNTNICTD